MKLIENVSINGNVLTCKHCGGGAFSHRTSLVNRPGMTFLGLEFLGREADVYVCYDCGFLHWFLTHSVRSKTSNVATDISCPECDNEIPAGEAVCSKCGWTYARREDPY